MIYITDTDPLNVNMCRLDHVYTNDPDGNISVRIILLLPAGIDTEEQEVLNCLDNNSVTITPVISAEILSGECSDIISNYFGTTSSTRNGQLSNRSIQNIQTPDEFI